MQQLPTHKGFTFNRLINGQYINELYDGDYLMVEETFSDVLKEYDSFLQSIKGFYQAEDVAGLKSAIHKIKPLCGYVGLTDLQTRLQDFENACQHGQFHNLANECTELLNNLIQAKSVIAEEKVRLSMFNNA